MSDDDPEPRYLIRRVYETGAPIQTLDMIVARLTPADQDKCLFFAHLAEPGRVSVTIEATTRHLELRLRISTDD